MTSKPPTSPHGPETARILLDIKAVNFRPAEPYIFTSGWASPVYIDCRKIISFLEERRRIIAMGADMLNAADYDQVAGGETAGIPYAAWMSEALDRPMLYVRKKPKGFGRNAQIEGDPMAGGRALLVEDLATDGASKVNFIDALANAEMTVEHVFVVFFYGIFPKALEGLEAKGVKLHYLATWWDVLDEARRGGDYDEDVLTQVEAFLGDPIAWSAAHGGRAE